RRADAPGGAPGTVVAVGADGVTIAGNGGSIRVGRLRVGAKKLPAAEAAAQLGLSVGDRFG
ncbi:MAG TPA: methionyl-tRNA formyltransferase, partial [Candidatus Dormibacteraeota bacterium]|nr:methionyl-tRNA formyltransferase [Candidatus Dormibacteraeota bacterium]